jgi:hypothetical protein
LEADSPDTVINNPPAEWSTAFDPTWAGGTRLSNSRQILLGASADKVWTVLVSIGNETDWCFGNWLWKLRSFFGRIFARIELENDPVSGTDPQPGDLLDVWKVCQAEEPQLLQMEMVKEMKIPGRGVLSFKLTESSANETILQLRADFTPRGIIGIIYWSVVGPILGRVFNSVLIKIGKGLRKTIIKGPVRAL